MRVRWTAPAADDLERIVDYIRKDIPKRLAGLPRRPLKEWKGCANSLAVGVAVVWKTPAKFYSHRGLTLLSMKLTTRCESCVFVTPRKIGRSKSPNNSYPCSVVFLRCKRL
jgi:hypothetical protein